MTPTAESIENLTLSIKKEIHVQASLENTFCRAARTVGAIQRDARRQVFVDED
jgi:hypothetical protein